MKIPILRMIVDVTSIGLAVEQIQSWLSESHGRYVCISNVHMCMEAFDNSDYADVVNGADLTVPDGKPIALAQQALGYRDACQVRGEDLTLAICQAAAVEGFAVGFYGATEEVLEKLQKVLLTNYPELKISYLYAPPFRVSTKEEDAIDIGKINSSSVDVLFVGLGCPKQEIWMAEHRDQLHCVMLGVGAAFDFIAGNKRNAPRWLQKAGLEWAYRLATEPRRLWKRYLKHNPRFVYYFLWQLFGKNFTR